MRKCSMKHFQDMQFALLLLEKPFGTLLMKTNQASEMWNKTGFNGMC